MEYGNCCLDIAGIAVAAKDSLEGTHSASMAVTVRDSLEGQLEGNNFKASLRPSSAGVRPWELLQPSLQLALQAWCQAS